MRTVRAGTLLLSLLCLLALAVPAAAQDGKVYSQAELDQLVGPIALYPDALLAQVLMACTYPLEVVEADRWVKANPNLKGKALEDALSRQSWDPSVISLCETPQLLDRMSQNLDWTQDLGNAFLGQQEAVMATAQRLRNEAYKSGNLKSNEQQKVEVQQQTIVIQPASPEVIYVPTYNPTVVYGSYWAYPAPIYPAWYAPWPGSAFVRGLAWGAGFAIGANMFGGCNWGGGNVYINNNYIHNNNIYKNTNYNKNQNWNKNTNINNKQNWNHDPSQRGNVRYGDNKTAQKYNRPNQSPASRDQARGYDRGGQQGAGAPNRGGQGTGNVGQNRANTGGKQNAFAGSGNASFDKQASNRGAQSRNKPSSGMSSYGGGNKGGGSANRSGGGANRSSGGGANRGGGGKRR